MKQPDRKTRQHEDSHKRAQSTTIIGMKVRFPDHLLPAFFECNRAASADGKRIISNRISRRVTSQSATTTL